MVIDLPLTVNPEGEKNSHPQQTIRFLAAGKGAFNVPNEIPVDCSIWEQARKVVENLVAS
jgi:hypothetical protein